MNLKNTKLPNITILFNFFYFLIFFLLLPNFGFNDFNYKVFYSVLSFIYFATLFIRLNNLFLTTNLLIVIIFYIFNLYNFSYLFIQLLFISIHPDFTNKINRIELFENYELSCKAIKYIIPIILLFSTATTQNAYLNFETLDHDVSTSIVVANDIFNGSVPYEKSWDDKQPLFYFFNFILLLIVGKNFVLYKIIFDVFIFINAYLIYNIVCKKYNQKIYRGLFASLAYISILSQPWANSEYSEIMSSTFLGLAFYLFLEEKFEKSRYFLSGLFFGISTLINIGSGIFVLGFILLTIYFLKFQIVNRLKYFILGISSIHSLVLIIYTFKGLAGIYLTTLIRIPLTYTSTDTFFFYDFRVFIEEIYSTDVFLLVLMLILLFSVINIVNSKRNLIYKSFHSSSFIVFLGLSIIFFFLAGKGFYHHLIYFVFFLPLSISFTNRSNLLAIFAISLITTFASYNVLLFQSSIANLTNIEKIYEDYPLNQVSKEIKRNFDDEFTILALDQVLLLFYLDKNNDVLIIHPTNHNEYFILDNLIENKFLEQSYIQKSIDSKPDILICSIKNNGELFYYIESINEFKCNEEAINDYLPYELEEELLIKGEYYPNFIKSTKIFIKLQEK